MNTIAAHTIIIIIMRMTYIQYYKIITYEKYVKYHYRKLNTI